jgi:hypothetical protein
VISTRLITGRPVIQVYAESNPGAGFESIEPSLEDVYFHHMADAAHVPAPIARTA